MYSVTGTPPLKNIIEKWCRFLLTYVWEIMSKAYLLVICLLFASFSGCITDDEPDLMPTPVVEEDDTIEPVGQAEHNNTSSNDTYYYENTEQYYYFNNESYYFNETNYLELISAIEALTDEVENLRMEIEEMKSSGYDAPENSTIEIMTVKQESFEDEYLMWTEPYMNITKNGNTVTLEYVGLQPYGQTSGNCTEYGPNIRFANVDGVTIASYYGGVRDWLGRGIETTSDCEWDEDDNNNRLSYWTTVTFTLPEEPVRFYFSDYDGQSWTFE